jgi:NAD(P)-dependent dehydrogenase (short-subunit alcohol dehydrogenase family)
VTGAGCRMKNELGNGSATAVLLARHGARVAVLDRNLEAAQETKRMIEEEGGVAEVVQGDVTVDADCKAAVAKTVQIFGQVDILVNIGECHMRPSARPCWLPPLC